MVQQKKVESALKIAERARAAQSAVFVDYRGLSVQEANRLRTLCREAGVVFQVVKNRLAKRALEEVGTSPPEEILRGPTAIAFGMEDPTSPARVLSDFAKQSEHLKIKGGFLGEKWLDQAGVQTLAKIPPREVLLARLMGGLRSPLVKLGWVLRAPLAQLSVGLKAVAEQKAA